MSSPRDLLKVNLILVADDDPEIRGTFVTKLAKAGYSVRDAKSGAEALRILRKSPYGVLVLNLDMENSDGFQILKAVKTECPGVHVVAVSGYPGGVFLEAAELLGATLSLSRVSAPRMLVKTVQRLVGIRNGHA
jgi:CheY-like chemotaxis protein